MSRLVSRHPTGALKRARNSEKLVHRNNDSREEKPSFDANQARVPEKDKCCAECSARTKQKKPAAGDKGCGDTHHAMTHGRPTASVKIISRAHWRCVEMPGSEVGGSFKPALLVVDVQEDFCPPAGSLAVGGGREIAPTINSLLAMPFALKIATRDFHPQDHISFETSHPSSNIKAFESSVKIPNPSDKSQSHEIPIWPVHCVQGTKGAEIIPEIDISRLDEVVEKGKDSGLEMFSGFADVFGSKSSDAASMDLAGRLKSAGITHVFTVGIAGDFCVKCTALDAKKEGFEVYVVEEATRSVDVGEKGWGAAKEEMERAGVKTINVNGPEIDRVGKLS